MYEKKIYIYTLTLFQSNEKLSNLWLKMMVLQSFVRKIFRDQARIYIRSIELFSRNKFKQKWKFKGKSKQMKNWK